MPGIWIGEHEVGDLIDLMDAIGVVRDALVSWDGGTGWTMRKTHAPFAGGSTLHAIGGGLETHDLVGTKTWVHTPRGAQPLLVLWNGHDGTVAAVIEAFALGQLRTAAITGVATDRLAAPEAKVAAMIGTGKQALAQLVAMSIVRALDVIRIWSPTPEHRAQLKAEAAPLPVAELTVARTLAEAIDGADIITTATRAQEAFLRAEHAADCPHINAIGAITPERRELADDLVRRCAPVVSDDPEAARELTTELTRVGSILPLAKVVASPVQPGPRHAPSLFKAVGIGLADVAIGAAVLERGMAAGIGQPLAEPRQAGPKLASRRDRHLLEARSGSPASSNESDRHREVLLVGSIPLPSAEDVFRTTSAILGLHLKRIPDGETGPARSLWLQCQIPVLMAQPQLECVMPDGHGGWLPIAIPAQGVYSFIRSTFFPGKFRRRDGIDEALRVENLGYAAWALDSYATFRRLKDDGVVPEGMRFQVCLPTPSIMRVFAVPEQQPILREAYQRGLFAEVARIVEHIPADELAIQWDCTEPCFYESASAELKSSTLDALAELASAIPDDVELGYHLCYGDFEHQHSVEPTDLSTVVEIANGITARASREISWVHMPVPRNRDDVPYFAPVERLEMQPATRLYLGLVHWTDGANGNRRRMAAASAVDDDYGVATECGFGRRPAETIPDLRRLHARLAGGEPRDRIASLSTP
jgi:ornithine cyclodeaminase/alanine dehydrogenase-like protein (mu-crystallin family)